MKGMHVIEKIPVKEYQEPLTFILLLIGIMIALYSLTIIGRKKKGGILCFVVGCLVMLSSLLCVEDGKRYRYTCTFDDTVLINDVAKKFDIISVENGKWTVQNKAK